MVLPTKEKNNKNVLNGTSKSISEQFKVSDYCRLMGIWWCERGNGVSLGRAFLGASDTDVHNEKAKHASEMFIVVKTFILMPSLLSFIEKNLFQAEVIHWHYMKLLLKMSL